MKARFMAAVSAAAALSACGSHSAAPVVYGTDPAVSSTGRVYNSPQDYARVNAPRDRGESGFEILPSSAQSLSDPLLGSTEETPLAPIPANLEQSEIPSAPTYLTAQSHDAAPEPAMAEESIPSAGYVTVRSGDTVYAIGRRTGSSPKAIIALNRLRAPFELRVGQTLRVPQGGDLPRADIADAEPQAIEMSPRGEALAVGRANRLVGAGRVHEVRSGDTLYSISRATGASVKTLAAANGLRPPYTLDIGDHVRIPAGAGETIREARRNDTKDLRQDVNYAPLTGGTGKLFDWPVKGAIIGDFGDGVLGKRNDGVNIAAPVGTPIRAAADGEVVYRGAELEGYGNLLLIKHPDGFVTAYAHNDVMLVQKGQQVRQGQVIAKVGQTGSATEPQLHFEIRQNLKAVNPVDLLKE
jgi:murein DD-endopeptidase MepM/ murein hydrolase activator NlpD